MNQINCLLCSHSIFTEVHPHVRDSKKFGIKKCNNCHHVQIFPLPTLDEEKKYYEKNLQDVRINYHGSINDYRKKSENDTLRRVKFIKKIYPKGRILDIGSGDGFFMEAMISEGYDVEGIEMSKNRMKKSRKITKGKISYFDLRYNLPKMKKFDVITMFHVLEHIRNLHEFLGNVKKLLMPTGTLIIEVPNHSDFQLTLNPNYKDFHYQQGHIHYFTPVSIKKILQICNFKKIKVKGIQRYSIENMFYWRLFNQPQINEPKYELLDKLNWLENFYKNQLETKLKSDTIIVIAKV